MTTRPMWASARGAAAWMAFALLGACGGGGGGGGGGVTPVNLTTFHSRATSSARPR